MSNATYYYRISGLDIASDIRLNSVPEVPDSSKAGTVSFRAGKPPHSLTEPDIHCPRFCARDDEVLVRIPQVGRFHIRSGSLVEYCVDDEASPQDAVPFLLGSCLGALIHQREGLILHASSVVRNGKVFLICGRSGAGKSTTTAHLVNAGGSTLGDDIAVIGKEDPHFVQPAFPTANFSRETLNSLGLAQPTQNDPVTRQGKFTIETGHNFENRPMPLGGIIAIERTYGKRKLARLSGAKALQTLRRHTYRKSYLTKKRAQLAFAGWSKIAQDVPLYEIMRPHGEDTLQEVLNHAEQAIKNMMNEHRENV